MDTINRVPTNETIIAVAYEKFTEKANQWYAWLDVSIVDLRERGLALLWLAATTAVATIYYRRKQSKRYETNPALYQTWANNMEC